MASACQVAIPTAPESSCHVSPSIGLHLSTLQMRLPHKKKTYIHIYEIHKGPHRHITRIWISWDDLLFSFQPKMICFDIRKNKHLIIAFTIFFLFWVNSRRLINHSGLWFHYLLSIILLYSIQDCYEDQLIDVKCLMQYKNKVLN